jgi:hypothetical protein
MHQSITVNYISPSTRAPRTAKLDAVTTPGFGAPEKHKVKE